MTNENPVMFEYGGTDTPWNANATHSIKYDEQVECFCVFEIAEEGVKTFRFVNDYDLNAFFEAKTLAKLKAQGWLSPADQRPFCMESVTYTYFPSNLSEQYKAFYYNDDGKLDRAFDACGKWLACDDYYIGNPQAFLPIDEFGLIDYPECARLDALGVKRYEQGGGE
jgi:hypothetical protein